MERAFADQKRVATQKIGEVTIGVATSAATSALSMAYNLYLVHHNLPANTKTDELCQRLLKRLKNPDHFWGTLYETYAFSLFALAGFAMELEDESDRSTTHCEFSARGKSGRTYSIECKARNRQIAPVNDDGSPRIDGDTVDLSKKLKAALSKAAAHERIVFLDLGLPAITEEDQFKAVAALGIQQLRELECSLEIDSKPAPPAYIFVTNMPDNRSMGDTAAGIQAFAVGFKIPDFGHGVVHHGMHALMKSRERHADLLSLKSALESRHIIPSTFDGSNPALAFSEDPTPRLRVGNWYKVPSVDGTEIEAKLTNAVVMESEKSAFCFYRTQTGECFSCINPMTDDELSAYKLHPTTFFGAIDHSAERKGPESVVDLFDFFFESYQHTSKEKLLEFMSTAPDHEDLEKLNQRDLAITYCERLALATYNGNAQ